MLSVCRSLPEREWASSSCWEVLFPYTCIIPFSCQRPLGVSVYLNSFFLLIQFNFFFFIHSLQRQDKISSFLQDATSVDTLIAWVWFNVNGLDPCQWHTVDDTLWQKTCKSKHTQPTTKVTLLKYISLSQTYKEPFNIYKFHSFGLLFCLVYTLNKTQLPRIVFIYHFPTKLQKKWQLLTRTNARSFYNYKELTKLQEKYNAKIILKLS